MDSSRKKFLYMPSYLIDGKMVKPHSKIYEVAGPKMAGWGLQPIAFPRHPLLFIVSNSMHATIPIIPAQPQVSETRFAPKWPPRPILKSSVMWTWQQLSEGRNS
jgi:hypothetical protein